MDPYLEPEFEHSALVTIDVQRDTLDGGRLEIAGTSAALRGMARLAAAFRAAGRPIVHVVRLYRPDGANVDLCRRSAVEQGAPLLLAGSEGAQLARDLMPDPNAALDPDLLLAGEPQQLGPGEWALYKPRWGAFFRTRLDQHLRELGVGTLVFCGANFPNCPRTSIYQASERDYRLAVAFDGVSGLDERGRADLEGIGVRLMSADKAAEAVAAACRAPALGPA